MYYGLECRISNDLDIRIPKTIRAFYALEMGQNFDIKLERWERNL